MSWICCCARVGREIVDPVHAADGSNETAARVNGAALPKVGECYRLGRYKGLFMVTMSNSQGVVVALENGKQSMTYKQEAWSCLAKTRVIKIGGKNE